MKPKTLLWTVVAIAVAAVAIVVLFRPAGGGIENVDTAGAKAAMEQPGIQIIDVRTQGEYDMGHLPGAINVPENELATAAQGWDKSATYLVYCATGSRSAGVVEMMRGMGFTSIKHYAQGLVAWDQPLEQGSTASTTRVETDGKPVLIEFFTDS